MIVKIELLFYLKSLKCFISILDDMIERTSVSITLHDVDPTALRQLIDYTYTGEITITEDNVQVRLAFIYSSMRT